jgi:hypothetical protein
MNKNIYLVIILLIITACGGNKDQKEKSGIASHSVNSALVEVSEVVGVGKVEPEKEIISLAAKQIELINNTWALSSFIENLR